jgi:hypothetical protein
MLILLSLAIAACGEQKAPSSSVTVKLPPAKPAPAPGFTFGRDTIPSQIEGEPASG